MRRPSGRTPYPWDLWLSNPAVGTARLLLATDQSGTQVVRHRHIGLENVTPTDFAYGSQSPFTRRTALFKRLVMGMGQPVEVSESSQRYSYALGMDWSCGLGALATRFVSPRLIGSGPIKSIEQLTIGGTRYLCVLSGNEVWTSTVADIELTGDFTLQRNFGTPATPPAPTGSVIGGAGAATIWYSLALSGHHGGSGTGPISPPQSLAGPHATVLLAPATPTVGNYIHLTWTPQPSGLGVTLYRSFNAGTSWEQAYLGPNLSTVDDNGSLIWNPASPGSLVGSGQAPYQLLTAAPQGWPRLFVGMEAGSWWAWDGAAWTEAATDGRALTMEGFDFYRSSVWNQASTNPRPANFVYRHPDEPTIASPSATTPSYQDERPSAVTRLVRLNGTLFVFEENRIAVGTGGSITELTPDRGLPADPNNGRCACVWLGSVYAPFGMGLYKLTPTGQFSATVEAVGMERLIENDAPVQGRITALAPWGPWHLFWAAYNERDGVPGGTAYVGKYGAWINPEAAHDPNSQLIPVLHGALESWPGRRITWMQHSTIGEPSGNGRLYVGFDNGGLAWTILPGQTPFAPNDPVCVFRSTGFTVLSRHSMGFQADDKNYFDLTGFGPVVTNGQRVRFSYQLPEDTAWRDIPGEVTEGGEPLVFPEGAQGKWIQLMVTMETDVDGDSPVIEGVALGEQLRPSSIEEISFTAHVGPRLVRRDGHVTRVSARELHDLLRRLEAKGDDVTVLLPDGETQRAAINDFTDRYLEGSTTMGPRHDMSLTLLTFRTAS
jgi:hypothetical protein